MAKHELTNEERSKGGQRGKKEDPVKKRLDALLNDLIIDDKLNAKDLWEDIQAIKDPARRFDRKLALIELKVPKPKEHDIKIEMEGGYIIGGLTPPEYESNG